MSKIIKYAGWSLAGLVVLMGLLVGLVWGITYHPADIQEEAVVCAADAPILEPGQSVKVLTYNVQYMAGKNYVFFYDLPHNAGPDERPTAAAIDATLREVARIIQTENPDVVLLQEVDDGAARTEYEDQLARLLTLLPQENYRCQTAAFYWKADFVPHPRIMGSIGQKLAIISKYQINQATRYQLPVVTADPLTQQFSPKQAILEARLPVANSQDFALLATHLEVANRGTEVMQQQVAAVMERLESLNREGYAWLIGGDFNLLPPGQFERLAESQQPNFRAETELKPLIDRYRVIPDPFDVNGEHGDSWLTMFTNDPATTGPDRTLDYIFYADRLTLLGGYVRQHDTLTISDHLPLIAEFRLP
jgi:endonuclease/exonuclease/phosphatase family metal-dependent hydrolase